MTITALSKADHADTGHPRWREHLQSVGVPRTDVEVRVVDDADRDLPAGELGSPRALLAAAVEKAWTLRELSDAYIEEALRRAGGNRTLAARRLGVSRKSLWERGRRAKKPVAGRK